MAKSTAKKKAPAKKAVAKSAKKPALTVVKKAKKVVPVRADAEGVVTRKESAAVTPNETNLKIVMGVVRPPRVRLSGASPYPFKSLPVGGSFMIPAEVVDKSKYATEKEGSKAQAEACGLVANRLSGATRRFTKRNEGYKFTVFTVDNGTTLGFDSDIGVVVQRTK